MPVVSDGSCIQMLSMTPMFHQGRSEDEELTTARSIRIQAELHNLCKGLGSRDRTLLARRIRRDVLQNGVDLALVAPGAIEAMEGRRCQLRKSRRC